jgi:hypothetical protein
MKNTKIIDTNIWWWSGNSLNTKRKTTSGFANPWNQSNNEESTNDKMLIFTKPLQSSHSWITTSDLLVYLSPRTSGELFFLISLNCSKLMVKQ